MEKQKILIVDDVAVNRLILKEVFKSEYEIEEAENGKVALNILKKQKDGIAAVILDNLMPVMTGQQVLVEMQKDAVLSEIPTIMVTSSGTDEAELSSLSSGVSDFIVKPFNPIIIKQRVKNLIEKRDFNRIKVGNARLIEQARIMNEHRKVDERFRIMCEKSSTILMEKDLVTNERFFSNNITEHFDGEYGKNTSLSQTWIKYGLVRPYDRDRLVNYIADVSNRAYVNQVQTLMLQLWRKDGSWQWYRLESVLYKGEEEGDHERVIIMVNNIDNLMKYRQEVENKAELVNRLTSTMSICMFVCEDDNKHTFYYIHDNFCALLGYRRKELDEISGGNLLKLVYKGDREEFKEKLKTRFDGQKKYTTEFRLVKKNGGLIWVQNTCTLFLDQDGVIRINNIITDVTVLKNAMEELRYRAEFDSLTGLYNKNTFFQKAKKMIDENKDVKYCIMRIDIERFKVINDLYGIETGDRLLVFLAEAVRDVFDGKGVYAHLESDNFIACFPYDRESVESAAKTISEKLNSFMEDFEIVVAYGCYTIDDASVKITLMSDRAYLALCSVKGIYTKRIGYYDDSMMKKIREEQHIVNDMNAALTENQFTVFFQPQFNHTTGKIIGAEALVRWFHPTKGMISPASFIPTFEKNGFITKVDEYVWDKSCKWLSSYLKAHKDEPPIYVSVNISRLDIYNSRLCETLLGIVRKYDVPVNLFRLEITESAYVENPKQLIEVVEELQNNGFIIEMDDFGSGYSSLNTLKEVPVDVLKLDLRFLAGDDKTGRGGNILQSMVRMAKWLNLEIIAEGVETKNQADFLSSIGSYIIQGYYYAKPMPISDFEKLLASNLSGTENQEIKNTPVSAIADTNANDYWNPDSPDSVIFNSYIGAAVMFSYSDDGEFEILRVNDRYFDVLQTTHEVFEKYRMSLFDVIVPEYRNTFLDALKCAVATGEETECTTAWLRLDSPKYRWIFMRIKAMTQIGNRIISYAQIEDISETVELKEKLEKANKKIEELENR